MAPVHAVVRLTLLATLLQTVGHSAAASAVPGDTSTRALSPSQPARPLAPPKTDFYGNEISDAVATYGTDRSGNLVEEHSPHTEVPMPGSPTT